MSCPGGRRSCSPVPGAGCDPTPRSGEDSLEELEDSELEMTIVSPVNKEACRAARAVAALEQPPSTRLRSTMGAGGPV